nr:LuxR family transcriptional regulator [Lentzea guizhouensis]
MSDLVGREAECENIVRLARTSRDAGAHLVLVRGPKGIGKSTLLTAVRRRLEPDVTVLSGLIGNLDTTQDDYAVMCELYRTAVHLMADRPLVILHDANTCDDRASRSIGFLLRRAAELPLVVVLAGTGQVDLAGVVPTITVELGPLSTQDVAVLVERAFGRRPDPSFAETCGTVTGGNPLRLTTLLTSLRAAGTIPDASGVEQVRELGRQLLTSRLQDLVGEPEHVHDVARAVAVLAPADTRTVGRFLQLPEPFVTSAVETLRRNEVLAAGELEFRHEDIAGAVLAAVPTASLTELRHRAATVLNDEGRPAEEVAGQLVRLPDLPEDWMCWTLREAAAAAVRRGALDAAERYLTRVLDEVPGDQDTLVDLADVLVMTGPATALPRLTEVVDQLADTGDKVKILCRVGLMALADTWSEAAFDRLAGILDEGANAEVDSELLLQVHAALLTVGLGGEPAATGRLLARYRLAPRQTPDTASGRLIAGVAAHAEMLAGECVRSAVDLARLGLVPAAEVHTGPAVTAAAVLGLCGEQAEALAALERLVTTSGEDGALDFHVLALAIKADLLDRAGDLTQAHAAAQAAVEVVDRAATPVEAAPPNATMASILLKQGRVDEAEDHLDRIAEPPFGWAYGPVMVTKAAARRARGDLPGALDLLLDCGRQLTSAGVRNPVWAPWWLDALCLLVQLDRRGEAVELAEFGAERARRWNTVEARGLSLMACGTVATGTMAAELLEAAVAELAESSARPLHTRAVRLLGASRLADGDAKGAREHLRAAVTWPSAREIARRPRRGTCSSWPVAACRGWGGTGGRAQRPGAAGRRAGRGRCVQPGDRRGAVRDGPHGREPPVQRVPQARGRAAHRPAGRAHDQPAHHQGMTGIQVIATALRLAQSGVGTLVVLRGPLGCGRTTVAQDAKRVAESLGIRVLRACGAWQERDFPFGVVHQLSGSAAGDLAEVLVAAGPVLVVVDDLQWADDESLRALARSTGLLDRTPVVLVVCVRDGEVGSGSALVDQVVRRADHVVALQRPFLTRDSKQKLVTCLRGQPYPVRSVLNAMAVLGDDSDDELIAPLAEVDEIGCTTALHAAERLGLVDRAPPRFVHHVVREAVEDTMAPADQARLQARAVRLLHDVGRPAEAVADRLLAITVAQGPWAVEVLRTAAASAVERGAPRAAVEYLRRALFEQPRAGWRRAALLVELADAERGADRAAAAVHLAVAAGMVTTTEERAAIAARFVPGALVEAPPAVRELVKGIGDVPGDLALRIEARAHYVDCMAPRRSARCVDRLGEGPDTSSTTSAGRELLAVQLHCATTAAKWRADDVAAAAQRLLADAPPRPDHVHTPIATLVTTLCAADSLDAVSAWLDNAVERAHATNAVAEQTLIEAEQVLVLLHRGRTAVARTLADDILATTGPIASEALVALASLACETQDEHLVGRLLPLLKERTTTPAPAVAHRMLCGAAAVAAADLRAGLAHFQDAGSHLEELGWRNPVLYPWRAEAARILWRLGDVTAARELAAHQHALAVAWGAPAGVGKALCHLGSMTEGDTGVALLRQAVRVLEGSANRFELARALWQLGTRTGDRESLDRSSAVAVECGESPLVAREEPAGRGDLTGAQHRVVELALAGRSNQEIADLMRVGVRVVEKHLTNAYRKLGVQGRNGLAAAFR